MDRNKCCNCRKESGPAGNSFFYLVEKDCAVLPASSKFDPAQVMKGQQGHASSNLKGDSQRPVLYIVPKSEVPAPSTEEKDPPIIGEEILRKHFNIGPPALYNNPQRRPLITFPMGQEQSKHFNMFKRQKMNQAILDGLYDPSEAVSEPSPALYAKPNDTQKEKETVYLIELPDSCECHSPQQGQPKQPRYIWHTVKKTDGLKEGEEDIRPRLGKGVLHKPKPWLISRLTDFDALSQW